MVALMLELMLALMLLLVLLLLLLSLGPRGVDEFGSEAFGALG